VALLPEELSCTEEGLGVLEFPTLRENRRNINGIVLTLV
jgi:hypothetical protein